MQRILCFLLAALLLAGTVPASCETNAAMTVSDMLVEMIKEYEGFLSMPYSDGIQWYIGYGTSCSPGNYPSGITEAQASQLLRDTLNVVGESTLKWANRKGVSLTQQQFDALVSFGYGVGIGWVNNSYLSELLLSGTWSESAIVHAFGRWCHFGGKVLKRLVERRLEEAMVFLYGIYGETNAPLYYYIEFDAGDGEMDSDISFYPAGTACGTLPTATLAGYTLTGWVTDTGVPVTVNTVLTENIKVSAVYAAGTVVTADPTAPTTPTDPTNPTDPITPTAPVTVPTQPVTQPTQPVTVTFRDVGTTDWYASCVTSLASAGVVSGYPDGTFRPKGKVTTGEALKLVLLAAGHGVCAPAAKHWASGYLSYAVEQGMAPADKLPELDSAIDRLTVARLAAAALGLSEGIGHPFIDTDDGYVTALYNHGILEGSVEDGTRVYKPDDGITRAELCAIVKRLMDSGLAWTDNAEDPNEPAPTGYLEINGRMTYAYAQTWTGIDVSAHNGKVNWSAVASDGIDFAMLRLGFRGSTLGVLKLDERFEDNLCGAQAAGIPVGVYFYSQAITVEEAEEEAALVLRTLGGRALQLPIAYDWELVLGDRSDGVTRETLTACTAAFCAAIERGGYDAMIYLNRYLADTRYDLDALSGYPIWFAGYSAAPRFDRDFIIWQYGTCGTVAGIDGQVDMNLGFVDFGG